MQARRSPSNTKFLQYLLPAFGLVMVCLSPLNVNCEKLLELQTISVGHPNRFPFHNSDNSTITHSAGRTVIQPIADFLSPYITEFGNIFAGVKEAIPDSLTGGLIAIGIFKGIIIAIINVVKTILLPLIFWTVLIVLLIIGGALYASTVDGDGENENNSNQEDNGGNGNGNDTFPDVKRKTYDFEQSIYNALDNTYIKYGYGHGHDVGASDPVSYDWNRYYGYNVDGSIEPIMSSTSMPSPAATKFSNGQWQHSQYNNNHYYPQYSGYNSYSQPVPVYDHDQSSSYSNTQWQPQQQLHSQLQGY